MHDKPSTPPSSRGRRLAWLVGIWAASVTALAITAWLLRLLMNWAGMTTG